jgi:phosphate transport system substrate-binding protein
LNRRTKEARRRWVVAPLAALLVAGLALSGCGGAPGTITEAGSTSVQPLAEVLAEAYMADNPDVTIVIQGGGSSTGVKSAADRTVDIGAASRELKPSEPDLVKHLLARDGIAIVGHPGGPIDGMTREQVKEVFAGNIVNWSELGGPDEDIHVVAREEGSGTRGAFEEMVMGEEPITGEAILQNSNGAVRTVVSGTEWAIGFLSFGYIDSSIKALEIDGVAATTANALNGSYPVVRPFYFLTAEEPEGLVKGFLDFCKSPQGQDIVEDEGYIRVD